MRCYDCLQEARSDTIGIGVCSRCGLAICENHARVRQVQVTRQVGMGAVSGRIPARRVVCHACDMAETANWPHGALVAPASPVAECALSSECAFSACPDAVPDHCRSVRA